LSDFDVPRGTSVVLVCSIRNFDLNKRFSAYNRLKKCDLQKIETVTRTSSSITMVVCTTVLLF